MTGRTTAEVLRDPQHAEDVREAQRQLELADQPGMGLGASLAALDAAIAAFRRIDAREQAQRAADDRP